MNLTKKQAITEHRKMWKWISENLTSKDSIEGIKYKYLELQGIERYNIRNNCFLCEYCRSRLVSDYIDCDKCPLDWGNGAACNRCCYGYYGEFFMSMARRDELKARKIAKKIALLKEINRGS